MGRIITIMVQCMVTITETVTMVQEEHLKHHYPKTPEPWRTCSPIEVCRRSMVLSSDANTGNAVKDMAVPGTVSMAQRHTQQNSQTGWVSVCAAHGVFMIGNRVQLD